MDWIDKLMAIFFFGVAIFVSVYGYIHMSKFAIGF